MAELVLTHAHVRMGPSSGAGLVAMSTTVRSIVLPYSADMQDKTAMSVGTNSRIAGLKDWSVTMDLNQDYASTDIDKFLFDSIGSTTRWIYVTPTTAIRGAANPSFEGPVLLESYSPINGAVGDVAIAPVVFQADGNLVRTVAAT